MLRDDTGIQHIVRRVQFKDRIHVDEVREVFAEAFGGEDIIDSRNCREKEVLPHRGLALVMAIALSAGTLVPYKLNTARAFSRRISFLLSSRIDNSRNSFGTI